ncbi:MAG: cell division protein SepF [Limnothrix sp. CACIAM 69d]|nr:MAG: cell division protein SepF [Limnothrix sp. CACIAM 69d]
MNAIFTKLRDFVGLGDPVEYDYDYDENDSNNNGYRGSYQQPAAESQPAAAPTDEASARRSRRYAAVADASASLAGGFPAPAAARSPEPIVPPSPRATTGTPTTSSMSNVIGMPGAVNGISEVVVMEPRSFEEMPQAIQALRERKSVVLNLTMMDPDQAQRSVDFIAGGTYALDGHQERIGESIFLFTPSCVQVSTHSGLVREVFQAQAAAQAAARPGQAPVWATDRFQQAAAQ